MLFLSCTTPRNRLLSSVILTSYPANLTYVGVSGLKNMSHSTKVVEFLSLKQILEFSSILSLVVCIH